MKAARLVEWGKPLQLEDIPRPQPAEDQVLVRVRAASINPFDHAIQAGYLKGMASIPLTLGADFSGEVVSVGPNVTGYEPGDAVYGVSPLGGGTFAEYVVVKSSELARKPATLDFECAAGVGLPAMAAWISLYDTAGLKGPERVLVHGVAGNVGSLVLQFAKMEGAYVYGTDRPEKADHARELGIDHFVPSTERFETHVKDVDVVIDLVGGDLMERSYGVLKRGGCYVTSLLVEPPQEEPRRRGIRSLGLAAYPRADVLGKVAGLIDAGKIHTFIDRVFPLEDVNHAMAYRAESRRHGKVVLRVQ